MDIVAERAARKAAKSEVNSLRKSVSLRSPTSSNIVEEVVFYVSTRAVMRRRMKKRVMRRRMKERMKRMRLLRMKNMKKKKKRCLKKKNWDAAKNWEFGLCEESDEQLSMLHRLRYKIATKIMLHQFNAVSNKMFDFAFTFETKNTEQARVSMIVDAIKNRNNRDPPKQVKETDAANVVVGVNEAVDQVKEKGRRKK
ncbi:hypothetical protein Tco_0824646 [Tanacetum coccineum]|uniref:Uncharacterized protein n=1 Tax=Tanacetum coccineum TaxID=301880 RepID=A0ABQ5APR9_9ASTR